MPKLCIFLNRYFFLDVTVCSMAERSADALRISGLILIQNKHLYGQQVLGSGCLVVRILKRKTITNSKKKHYREKYGQ